jgi:hypothetical protein
VHQFCLSLADGWDLHTRGACPYRPPLLPLHSSIHKAPLSSPSLPRPPPSSLCVHSLFIRHHVSVMPAHPAPAPALLATHSLSIPAASPLAHALHGRRFRDARVVPKPRPSSLHGKRVLYARLSLRPRHPALRRPSIRVQDSPIPASPRVDWVLCPGSLRQPSICVHDSLILSSTRVDWVPLCPGSSPPHLIRVRVRIVASALWRPQSPWKASPRVDWVPLCPGSPPSPLIRVRTPSLATDRVGTGSVGRSTLGEKEGVRRQRQR